MSTYNTCYKLVLCTKPPQIRRFLPSHSTATDILKGHIGPTFVELCSKIEDLFPELNGKEYRITWKDHEGDFTIIGNDEELSIAKLENTVMHPRGHKIIKLFIQIIQNSSDEKKAVEIETEVHPHVVCDGCENFHIRGYRYKCIECPDFDLCQKCEEKGLHSLHCMLRIPAPQCLQYVSMENIMSSVPGRYKKKCTRDLPKRKALNKHNKIGFKNLMHVIGQLCDEVETGCPMSATFYEETKAPSTKNNSDSNGISDVKDVPDVKNDSHIKNASDTKSDEATGFEGQQLDWVKKYADIAHEFIRAAGLSFERHDKNGYEIYVGRPAEENTEKRETTRETHENNEGPGTSAVKTDNVSAKLSDMEKLKINETASENVEKSAETSKASTPPNGATALTEDQKSSNLLKSLESDEWLFVHKSDNTSGTTSPIPSAPPKGAIPKQETPPHHGNTTSQQSLYPSLPQRDVFYHPNPVIQKSVESMIGMGFSNEGGWLTQLLVSKNGDISKVLDMLQPVSQ